MKKSLKNIAILSMAVSGSTLMADINKLNAVDFSSKSSVIHSFNQDEEEAIDSAENTGPSRALTPPSIDKEVKHLLNINFDSAGARTSVFNNHSDKMINWTSIDGQVVPIESVLNSGGEFLNPANKENTILISVNNSQPGMINKTEDKATHDTRKTLNISKEKINSLTEELQSYGFADTSTGDVELYIFLYEHARSLKPKGFAYPEANERVKTLMGSIDPSTRENNTTLLHKDSGALKDKPDNDSTEELIKNSFADVHSLVVYSQISNNKLEGMAEAQNKSIDTLDAIINMRSKSESSLVTSQQAFLPLMVTRNTMKEDFAGLQRMTPEETISFSSKVVLTSLSHYDEYNKNYNSDISQKVSNEGVSLLASRVYLELNGETPEDHNAIQSHQEAMEVQRFSF